MPHVASTQTAQPADVGDPASADPMDRPWRTGFYKRPVPGPAVVTPETIVGDGVADRVNHGGPDKAILGYAANHYPGWQALLGPEATGGGFGENLTLDGQDERSVCVGDAYALGNDVLELTQTRQPCSRLGRRWRRADVPQLVIATGHTGWYFRVRTPGTIRPGDAVRLLDRPYPSLTVAVLNDMMYGRRPVTPDAPDCPALSPGWRRQLGRSSR